MSSEAQPAPQPQEGGNATPEEARAAIEDLTDGDFAKLTLIARGFCTTRLRGSVLAPEDLLQDAIAKTLDGTRTWNKTVCILKHLDRVMESNSGHEAAHRKRWPIRSLQTEEGQPDADIPVPPDSREEVRSRFEEALRLFDDDSTAQQLLRLKGDGYSPSEIQQELGMSKTQYESTQKRIKRRVAKHLADGGK